MSKIDPKVLRKIKKCLRLANSSNANEAAGALRAAQNLMKQHNISDAAVRLSDVEMDSQKVGDIKSLGPWHAALIAIINKAFATQAVVTRARNGYTGKWTSVVEFYGMNTNAELAGYAFAVVRRQIAGARKDFMDSLHKNTARSTKTRKADVFCTAIAYGLSEKIQALSPTEDEAALIREKMLADGASGSVDVRKFKGRRVDGGASVQGFELSKNMHVNTPVSGQETTKLTHF
jgi:hypothetical protein